jgi:hypothetical protein
MKLPQSTKNWLTIIGSIIAVSNFLLILLLFVISTIFNKQNTNLGLYIYIILPGFMVFGLILIPVGMFFERRRSRKKEYPGKSRLPFIDLNFHGSYNNIAFLFNSWQL